MARRILQRLKEIKTFPNVIFDYVDIKGKWNQNYFKNKNPITLELGCGKGEYTIELAQKFPTKNFVGMDIRGARLWKGAQTALELDLRNVAFLNAYIQEITKYFDDHEVEEIWITFPDPYPKKRHTKHRLTFPHFLKSYKKILTKGGTIHLKTDDREFWEYTKTVLNKVNGTIHEVIEDLYNTNIENEILTIKTTYERRHLDMGKKIYYLRFSI